MNETKDSPESTPTPPQAAADPNASASVILTRMEALAVRLEKAMEGTKDLPGRVSMKLDPKPIADALGNTLRLELSRTEFRERTEELGKIVNQGLREIEKLKQELVDVTREARSAIDVVQTAASSLPGSTKRTVEAADQLKALSFRWVFGSAFMAALVLAVVLTWQGRSHYREMYETKTAEAMTVEGPNREAAMELTRRGHVLYVGPVKNSFGFETGRCLKMTGVDSAVAQDGIAFIYLKAEPKGSQEKN